MSATASGSSRRPSSCSPSDGWKRWVRIRSRNGLARYSINNQLIIALSKPEATYVCGFRAWLPLGYQVRKGEKAIWILAPITVKNRDADIEEDGETPPSSSGPYPFSIAPRSTQSRALSRRRSSRRASH